MFIMNRPRFNSFRFFVIVIGLISLIQPGCDCSSSSGTGVPSAITSEFPPENSDGALVSTLVTATFRDDMNGSTINKTTFTLTLGGAPVAVASVTYDAATKTATLTPAEDLVSGSEYRASVSSSVTDIDGILPLARDYVWSFTISSVTFLVSENDSNAVGNNASATSDISGNGRYVVFESTATNLTSDAVTNLRTHIYRKDTITGEVLLVSSDANGLEGNNNSFSPRISDDGRYVVFESRATNFSTIVTGGTNQVFIKDLEDDSVELVSRDATGLTTANNASSSPVVSNDGMLVAFVSTATNLTAISSGGIAQVYLKNLSNESIEMISRTSGNAAGDTASANPDMSPDGVHIVFESRASNLPATNAFLHIYYVDTSATSHSVEQISVNSNGSTEATADCFNPSVSDDGSHVVFHTIAALDTLDTNGFIDVYFRDRNTPLTRVVSANPSTQNGGNGNSLNGRINGDDNYVTFESFASDLATDGMVGVKDIYIRDLSTNPTITIDKINLTPTGGEADQDSQNAAISSDGRYVSFDSAFGYDTADTNTLNDIYRAYNSTF